MFSHSNLPLLQGGFVGVDVFFVLSGYLITGLLVNELKQKNSISILDFYARRLKRLFPAMALMLIVSVFLSIWLLSGAEARAQLSSSPFVATWTSNIYFAFQAVDYFDELSTKDLFLHTWSLGIEEQFYLFWPLILILASCMGRSKTRGKQIQFRRILFLFIFLFLGSLLIAYYWTSKSPMLAFYLMPARIWQFSLGALAVLWLQRPPMVKNLEDASNSKFPLIIVIVGLVFIITSGVTFNTNMTYPGFWAMIPSFGAFLVIIGGLRSSTDLPQLLLTHPVLVWLGDRSYALYLWHWPIFMLGFSLGIQHQTLGTMNLILLSLLASIISFKLVELPFWKGRFSHFRPSLVILVSLLSMLVLFLLIYKSLEKLPMIGTQEDISYQWRNDFPEIYKKGCDAWYYHAVVEPCVFGTDTSKKTAVFFVDSIGAQWFSMYKKLLPESDWRIVVLTKSSCPIIDVEYFYPRIGSIYHVCGEWRNASLDFIEMLKPDLIIIGNAATYEFNETEWVEGSTRIFERISRAAAITIVIPGTPSLGFDGPGCVSRDLLLDMGINFGFCSAKGRLKPIQKKVEYLNTAVSRFANIYLLNLNDLVCPKGICSAITKEGIVVFRDAQHLTDSFVVAQVPVVRERWNLLLKNQ